MAQKPPAPKLFTVEEANRQLPKIQEALRSLRAGLHATHRLESQIAVVELSWLQEDGTVSEKAEAQVNRLLAQLEDGIKEFEAQIGRLNHLGAQLKDLDIGLVDFFAVRSNELVYLCWKEGEDQIQFWHDLESGFSGRQPIESL